MININALHYRYGDRLIFNGINLSIPHGKITVIMGPSGCGKTTLLKLMGAQLYPDAGQILIDDVDIHQLSRKALFEMRRNIGVLFQAGGLFSDMTVFDNVAFPLREHTTLSEDMVADLVLMKLKLVGLEDAHALMPSELSGGMARRVAMARALALDPQLMMYDEPFAGQDPITLGTLAQLIKRLNQTLSLTSVLVSHRVRETAKIADYMYLLGDGAVVAQGTPEAIFKNRTPKVFQFVHALDASIGEAYV